MVDFASYSTFDPKGAGLGNLFNRISPLEALGIWPSGDFRVEPGDGFAPAVRLLARAPRSRPRRSPGVSCGGFAARELAVPAALAAAALLIALRPRRRHALPGGEGDLDRRAARDAGRGAGLFSRGRCRRRRPRRCRAAQRGVRRCPRRRLRLLRRLAAAVGGAAGARERAGGAGDIPPEAHRAAAEARRPSTLVLAPPSSLLGRARPRLPRLGAAGRAGLRGPRGRTVEGAAARGRLVGDHRRRSRSRPSPGSRSSGGAGRTRCGERQPQPVGEGGCPLIAPEAPRANPARLIQREALWQPKAQRMRTRPSRSARSCRPTRE